MNEHHENDRFPLKEEDLWVEPLDIYLNIKYLGIKRNRR